MSIFLRMLFASLLFFQNVFSDELIKKYLEALSKQELTALEYYFQGILQENDGYVLYGDKPMSIGGVYFNDPIKLSCTEWESIQHRAYHMLNGWKQPSLDRKYNLIFTGKGDQFQRIVINRKMFLKVVNENISLFRYIVDPNLTAESLLADIIENQDCLHEIIKNNSSLTDILLGYGTNNSIVYSRYEDLSNCLNHPEIEFPYATHQEIKFKPLKGFHTLKEEMESHRLIPTSDIKDLWPYPLPYFGCDPETEETRALINTYERNREEILAATKQENFLEAILEKFFSTTANTLRLPDTPKHNTSFDSNDKKNTTQKLAELVLSETNIKNLNQNYILEMFLKGMDDFDQDVKLGFSTFCHSEAVLIEKELMECSNLELSEKLLNKLSKTKKWVPLIKDNILYKVIKKGTGDPMSSKVEHVTFHYSLNSIGRKDPIKPGTISETPLIDLIPGIAHSLVGMKKGEERNVFIHPRYAYGDQIPYSNQGFLTNVQLIDFKEGLEEAAIQKPLSLDSTVHRITCWGEGEYSSYLIVNERKKDCKPISNLDSDVPNPGSERIREKLKGSYEEILAKYEKNQGECFYFHGRNLRKSLKKNEIAFDFDEFRKWLGSKNKNPQFNTEEQRTNFIVDFKLRCFHLEHSKTGQFTSI